MTSLPVSLSRSRIQTKYLVPIFHADNFLTGSPLFASRLDASFGPVCFARRLSSSLTQGAELLRCGLAQLGTLEELCCTMEMHPPLSLSLPLCETRNYLTRNSRPLGRKDSSSLPSERFLDCLARTRASGDENAA